MRTFDVPGLSDPVGLTQIIIAASALVGAPFLGWLIQRVTIATLKRRTKFMTWRGKEIVIRAIRSVVIAGMSLAGGLIALSALPLRAGLRHGLERFLVAVLIMSVTWVTARVATDLVKLATQRTEETRRSSSIFINLSRFVVGILGILFLLQNLGVSITPILTALGVGGLALALALQDTLANFFAGLQLVATKKVKRGDYVRLETGDEGYVVDIDWRHTSIRQLPSNMILVPNSKLSNSVITNFYYPRSEMSVLFDVGVDYGSDLRQVERVTIDVARETLREIPGGVSDFEPFIRFHTFNDSSIDFTVILRVHEYTDQYLVKHDFVKRLHERYRDEGIVIPFPMRTLDWPEARSFIRDQELQRLATGSSERVDDARPQ